MKPSPNARAIIIQLFHRLILIMPIDIAAAQQAALPPPIVVLGTRPAATALVGAMIGRNSAAFAFPHLNLFVSDTVEGMVTSLLDPGQTHVHGLLRAVAYIYGSEQTIISIGMARRWLSRRLSWSSSQVFDELRNRVAPRRVVDKSPIYSSNAKCLERIRNTFPDAYYVHVIEHPLTLGAVSASVERTRVFDASQRRAGPEISPRDQLQWLNSQRLISESLNHVAPEKRVVVRMESLLADPGTELSDLCARLDLPNDEATVAEMLHPENSPFASLGPVGANLGDDPAFLRDPTFPPKIILEGSVRSRQNEKHMLPEVAEFAARYDYE
jgi:Sulfotransferase family